MFVAPGNLFLRLTVEQQTTAGAALGTAAALAVADVKRWITLTPVLAAGSVIDTTQRILNAELYINNIRMMILTVLLKVDTSNVL